MTLVVVGNFDRDALVSQIKSTFGKREPRTSTGTKPAKPPYPPGGAKEVTGSLAPLLGSDGLIGFVYRTDGADSPDYYPLTVVGRYLNRVMYEKIRVERALSYSPISGYFASKDFGTFIAAADVNLDKVELAKGLLEEEIENLRQGRIKAEDIQLAEQNLSMGFAQSYESNSSVAGLYVQILDQLKTSDRPTNQNILAAKLTPADLQRVAQKYLRKESRVIIRSTPTMTYTQFFVGLGVLIIGVPGGGFYLLRRFVRRRRQMVPTHQQSLILPERKA
jgi:zinc protease